MTGKEQQQNKRLNLSEEVKRGLPSEHNYEILLYLGEGNGEDHQNRTPILVKEKPLIFRKKSFKMTVQGQLVKTTSRGKE